METDGQFQFGTLEESTRWFHWESCLNEHDKVLWNIGHHNKFVLSSVYILVPDGILALSFRGLLVTRVLLCLCRQVYDAFSPRGTGKEEEAHRVKNYITRWATNEAEVQKGETSAYVHNSSDPLFFKVSAWLCIILPSLTKVKPTKNSM